MHKIVMPLLAALALSVLSAAAALGDPWKGHKRETTGVLEIKKYLWASELIQTWRKGCGESFGNIDSERLRKVC